MISAAIASAPTAVTLKSRLLGDLIFPKQGANFLSSFARIAEGGGDCVRFDWEVLVWIAWIVPFRIGVSFGSGNISYVFSAL